MTIYLEPLTTRLNEVIVSAGRDKQYRTDAPVAISSISTQMIRETKATSLEQVLNKVSGVYMVDLGNEQHTMAIRQPIGYRSLFFYLEDGIPIRTTGDFNHNALIEINMAALKTIEVIRGPASSHSPRQRGCGRRRKLYHRFTHVAAHRAHPGGNERPGLQADRLHAVLHQRQSWACLLGGFIMQTSATVTSITATSESWRSPLKGVYKINDRNTRTNAVSYVDYKTDQTGGVDSANFFSRNYKSFHTFSYRLVKTFRVRSTLEHSLEQ